VKIAFSVSCGGNP
jgi:hypothetical protein